MIKINLNPEQTFDPSNIKGIDLYKLKPIPVFLSFLLSFVISHLSESYFESNLTNAKSELNELDRELSGLKRTITKYRDLEKQIIELKAHEESLSQKLVVARKVISEKKNPLDILMYLSKNTPDDLWITFLELDSEKMTLKGESLNFPSIKILYEKIKESIFFVDPKIVGDPKTNLINETTRVEVFEILTRVERFKQ